MKKSDDYLLGYADGMDACREKLTNVSLIKKVRLLIENTVLLCMAIGIILCFVAIVVNVLNMIFV